MEFPNEKFAHLDNKQLINLKYFYKTCNNLAMTLECDAEWDSRIAIINATRVTDNMHNTSIYA